MRETCRLQKKRSTPHLCVQHTTHHSSRKAGTLQNKNPHTASGVSKLHFNDEQLKTSVFLAGRLHANVRWVDIHCEAVDNKSKQFEDVPDDLYTGEEKRANKCGPRPRTDPPRVNAGTSRKWSMTCHCISILTVLPCPTTSFQHFLKDALRPKQRSRAQPRTH